MVGQIKLLPVMPAPYTDVYSSWLIHSSSLPMHKKAVEDGPKHPAAAPDTGDTDGVQPPAFCCPQPQQLQPEDEALFHSLSLIISFK